MTTNATIGLVEAWGIVITVALAAMWIFDVVLRGYFSLVKYLCFVVVLVGLGIIVLVFCIGPHYHPLVIIALKWQAVVASVLTYTHLVAKYLNQKWKVS